MYSKNVLWGLCCERYEGSKSMKRVNISKLWNVMRRKISVILIVCLLIPNVSYTASYSKEPSYRYVDEVLVDEAYIDDGMFYMPYNSFEVNEGDSNSKYVFKVIRKGDANVAAKVKLSMIDINAKYDRDYSIKVIDSLFFLEKVQNKSVSKSVEEFMRSGKYEEYNYSDAIVDGSILADDIMTDEEKENYVMSNEEKEKVMNDAQTIFDEYGMNGELEKLIYLRMKKRLSTSPKRLKRMKLLTRRQVALLRLMRSRQPKSQLRSQQQKNQQLRSQQPLT